jgi:UDP-glucose 4,6-dehydratase
LDFEFKEFFCIIKGDMVNILVTGGCGFIGSEVVNVVFQETKDLNRLVVLDRIDYCSRESNILAKIRADDNYRFIKGDLCNYDLMIQILVENDINMVIHMAAQSHVDLSFKNPLQFTRDNVMGTHTLLEACRQYGKLERFVHMSTDEVYGEVSHDEENPCTEEVSVLIPTNPYSASKAAAEHYVRAYGLSYKLPYVMIRGNNVYGPKQFPDKLIAKFISYLHLDRKVTIHGDGSSKRTFIHVNDMAKGILCVANEGKLGETYNIGSYNEFSVMEITKLLCKLMDKDLHESIIYVPDRNFNDNRYFIDHNKVLKLGWNEKIPFDEGILQTIDWYKDHVEEYDI